MPVGYKSLGPELYNEMLQQQKILLVRRIQA